MGLNVSSIALGGLRASRERLDGAAGSDPSSSLSSTSSMRSKVRTVARKRSIMRSRCLRNSEMSRCVSASSTRAWRSNSDPLSSASFKTRSASR